MKLSSMLIHLHTMDVLRKAALEVDVGTVVLKAVCSITAWFFLFFPLTQILKKLYLFQVDR